MSNVVLDTSAILAVVNREPGAEKVVEVGEGAVVSTLIVAEVVTWLAVRDTPMDEIRNAIEHFKLVILPFDHPRAYAAGLIVSRTRKRGLSLADRACLALAVELGLPVITADRAWRDLDLGVEIRSIR